MRRAGDAFVPSSQEPRSRRFRRFRCPLDEAQPTRVPCSTLDDLPTRSRQLQYGKIRISRRLADRRGARAAQSRSSPSWRLPERALKAMGTPLTTPRRRRKSPLAQHDQCLFRCPPPCPAMPSRKTTSTSTAHQAMLRVPLFQLRTSHMTGSLVLESAPLRRT